MGKRRKRMLSVKELLDKYQPSYPLPARYCGRVYTDTTDFSAISYGDIIAVGGRHFLVLRDEAERRFGLEDPKFWVKRCTCLEDGQSCILKLVFYEQFPVQIGSLFVDCYRSPEKEGRILELVRGDWRFMQGESAPDEKGNLVRVLELIRGKRLDDLIDAIETDHEHYFHEHFPAILDKFIGSCEAIGFLHDHGEKHGDIRRDHIWVEHSTGRYRWIDFDYAYKAQENPFGFDLFGLGNILLYIAGKGMHTIQDLAGTAKAEALVEEDFSLVFRNRLVNLDKIFPYIPERLSFVLRHFSIGANVYYESVDELLDDLRPCPDLIRGAR
jgi:hypothetical protein